jgi:uncharacterized membrane protein
MEGARRKLMRSSLVTIFTAMYAIIGLVIAGLAIPLILRRVPPNNFYGFRVPQTLNNPTIWYQANAVAGYFLLASGIILILAAIGIRFWFPGITYTRYTMICTAVLVISVMLSLLFSWLYLQSLNP